MSDTNAGQAAMQLQMEQASAPVVIPPIIRGNMNKQGIDVNDIENRGSMPARERETPYHPIKTDPTRPFNLYRSTIPSLQFLFGGGKDCKINGKAAVFVLGMYATQDEEEIKQLNAEIDNGHPMIYVDPETPYCDDDYLDEQAQIKKQNRAELLAELQASGVSIPKDFGNYDNKASPNKLLNTHMLSSGATASNSGLPSTTRLSGRK